ncbi:sugar ABC transporter permease [Paenibacillus agaridevorans]|uniref:Sugar ABC transporter permease n=1 Tax=Paenibacillus agaridevorans TaxID=171404 RepID=A0A2R5F3W2_9BACL|nr:ABC transporter permease subunit [Paenibacillus agaridevorans]GBG11203.1 sugar ABC transporter permease [Paenibacillus agaridevorans]
MGRKKTFALDYHLMLAPGILLLVLFSVVPMFGIVIAFQQYSPGRGIFHSEWTGLDNIRYMFQLRDSGLIFRNTLFIAIMKIVGNLAVPIVFALLLNELRMRLFKRIVQTVVYLPHFLSWVILAGILTDILGYKGLVNQLLSVFDIEPILFFASNKWFPAILIGSEVWKEFGFNTIVFLAALAGISPALYEAAALDGAGRWQRLRHVTLPGMIPVIVLLATLGLGNVLNAGFDQVFNLYNPVVYESGDIIDTYVYRSGLMDAQYGLATAVGLLKSVVSFVLIICSYVLASRFANYRIF